MERQMTLPEKHPRIKRMIKKETVRCTVKNYVSDSIIVYRLVRSQDIDADYEGEELSIVYYSISIIRLGGDGTRDEKNLTDVSRDYDEAFDIYEKFTRGTVPPEVADEIMDDLLGI